MSGTDTTAAFAAFRAAVVDDRRLTARLREPPGGPGEPREAFVARVLALGADHGFAFDDAAVHAAMREGEARLMAIGADVAPRGASFPTERNGDPEPECIVDWPRRTPAPGSGFESPGTMPRSTSSAAALAGWTPFRAAFRGERMWVDWCQLGARRMVEPFHFETIVEAMREPFNLALQRSTPIEALAGLPPGVPVAGLIFHMSRCGSTLISRALAALNSTNVVVEATPLRTVLRAHAVGRATTAAAAVWLRGLAAAYGQRRFPEEARLDIKFMAGDVLDIALLRAAFPGVPWLFVTRDPAAILASQRQAGGIDLMRGQIPAARLGLTEDAMWRMESWAYKAHMLKCYAEAGLAAAHRPSPACGRRWPDAVGSDEATSRNHPPSGLAWRGPLLPLTGDGARVAYGGGLVLDHADLPDAIWTVVAPHFGLALGPGDVDLMRAVGGRHSKRPDEPFETAHDPSRTGADAFRALANTLVGPAMAALDTARASAENGTAPNEGRRRG